MTAPDCLDPEKCPVPDPREVDLRRLRLARVGAGSVLHTAYRRASWPSLFNFSGQSDGRFSPLMGARGVIPSMYAAATQTVALLETAFHEVHASGARVISLPIDLARRGVVALSVLKPLALIDLRDEALGRLGLSREQLVATTPQHYACTRQWALALHDRRIGGVSAVGLVWHSRIAELARADSLLLGDLLAFGSEACVLFGDRVPTTPRAWVPGDPHYEDLSIGNGRLLAEQIAEHLGAVIVPI